jgi:hypothetical protein
MISVAVVTKCCGWWHVGLIELVAVTLGPASSVSNGTQLIPFQKFLFAEYEYLGAE